MMKNIRSTTGLLLLAAAFLLFNLLNNALFSGWRLDLTEGKLYTLSEGSRNVVAGIDEPITLHFFFSQRASDNLTGLRAYATRVRELLEEYALVSDGRIILRVIDPEPFSEAEDQAAAFGLQSVPVNTAGDELYFGLAGTNALDDVSTITFFQPDREAFLEYEVSKIIQELSVAEKPSVGLISPLKVRGDVDMQTFQSTPAWTSISQLEQLFDVLPIALEDEGIPEGLELLVVIHPRGLSDAMLFAIDQYVMAGGKLLVFVDPMAESDRQQQGPMPMPAASQASDLDVLTSGWGVTLRPGKVLGDAQHALAVTTSDGTPVRHLAIVAMTPENLAGDDVITAQLETLNLASAGVLDVEPVAGVTVTPLIESSEYAMPLDAMQFQFMTSPADLQQGFAPTGEKYPVAVRIAGQGVSAFPDGVEGHEGAMLKSTENLNVIVVADTDVLTDRLWVRVQNFFGQQIATPWADNGDLLVNAAENLAGSADLISVRSRGRYTRPFTVVQDLRREAEARYLESATALEAELAETERKLGELESSKAADGILVLSDEQQAELERFQQEKLQIRKDLRDVSHQLEKDIQALGSMLKFLNVALVPLLLTLALLGFRYIRMRAGEPS